MIVPENFSEEFRQTLDMEHNINPLVFYIREKSDVGNTQITRN